MQLFLMMAKKYENYSNFSQHTTLAIIFILILCNIIISYIGELSLISLIKSYIVMCLYYDQKYNFDEMVIFF